MWAGLGSSSILSFWLMLASVPLPRCPDLSAAPRTCPWILGEHQTPAAPCWAVRGAVPESCQKHPIWGHAWDVEMGLVNSPEGNSQQRGSCRF